MQQETVTEVDLNAQLHRNATEGILMAKKEYKKIQSTKKFQAFKRKLMFNRIEVKIKFIEYSQLADVIAFH